MTEASTYLLEIGAHDGGLAAFTLYVSSGGYVTGPNDNPPDTEYPAAIIDPGFISRSLFGEGRTLGPSEVGYGEIVLSNADGGLDHWLDYGFDGRGVTLKRLASRFAAYASAETMLLAFPTRLDSSSAFTEMRLRLYDRRDVLDKPLQTNRYGGTTASAGVKADGTADMKARPKPLCYGTCLNVPAVPVNPFNLIYQVHDGAVFSITPYDGGVPLTATSNYATLSALVGATVPAGKFATCNALGLFRLGGTPAKVVTANVIEGASLGVRNAAQVARRIMGKMQLTGASNITVSTFNDLGVAAPAEVGIFINDDTTALEVLGRVLGSIGGYILPNHLGVFEVGRLAAPSSPAWSLAPDAIHTEDIGLVVNPDTALGLPVYRVIVRYRKIWQTQDDSALGGCVSIVDRAILATGFREAMAEDVNVQKMHVGAPALTIDTLIVNAADATAEAARRLALYKIRRDVLTFPVRRDDAVAATLGSTGTVTMPRLGYQNGRNMVVIGRRESPAREMVDLTLWG